MTRRVKFLIAVPLAVLAVIALLVGIGALAGGGSESSSSGVASSGSSRAEAAIPAPASGQVMGSDAGTAGKSTSGGSAVGEDYAAAIPPASAPSSHYLVRTGDLSLRVARGSLLATVERVKATTAGMNGYVMSSSVGTQTGGVPEPMPPDTAVSSEREPASGVASSDFAGSEPFASLVVRVPEQLFDTAVKRFSRLGEVRSASTSSEDVTSQYVDLQARLRHFRAVERRLVSFLQETSTVNQMLAVQDRIDRVQLTIEELSAQLKSLSETTSYGTLSVYITEKGRTPAVVHAGNSFGGTFWNSVELLGRGARIAGLVLTAVAPFLVVFGAVGVLAWYVVRRARRNRRHPAQPTLPV
jgi:hypothetical protein